VDRDHHISRQRLARAAEELRGLMAESIPAPEVSIVLPCLNEGAGLVSLAAEITAALSGQHYEVVWVDDGSTDDTWRVIRELVDSHPRWRAVRFSRRFGHQAALLAGLRAARGEAVITMDADGQHPPRLLPEMLASWRAGAKVVQMIRLPSERESWCKRTTSQLFYRVFSVLCDVAIRPAAADFRLLDRQVVDVVLRSSGPVPFLRGLIPWMGWPTVELPYVAEPRRFGRTQYSFRRMTRLALDGIMSFSIVPLRLGIWTGLLLSALSFAYLGYIGGIRIFTDAAIPGWASIAGLLALLGGVQLLCIGLLGEYLGRLYVASLDRPRYIVADSLDPAAAQPALSPRLRRAGPAYRPADPLPAAAHEEAHAR